jgi:hypothetical protein
MVQDLTIGVGEGGTGKIALIDVAGLIVGKRKFVFLK